MSQDTLKAIMHECLMPGLIKMSAGTIRNLWSAIEDGHRQFGYTPPWRCTEETPCATAADTAPTARRRIHGATGSARPLLGLPGLQTKPRDGQGLQRVGKIPEGKDQGGDRKLQTRDRRPGAAKAINEMGSGGSWWARRTPDHCPLAFMTRTRSAPASGPGEGANNALLSRRPDEVGTPVLPIFRAIWFKL